MARLTERLDRLEKALADSGIELPPLGPAVEEPAPAPAEQTAADEAENAAPDPDAAPGPETATDSTAEDRETRAE